MSEEALTKLLKSKGCGDDIMSVYAKSFGSVRKGLNVTSKPSTGAEGLDETADRFEAKKSIQVQVQKLADVCAGETSSADPISKSTLPPVERTSSVKPKVSTKPSVSPAKTSRGVGSQ